MAFSRERLHLLAIAVLNLISMLLALASPLPTKIAGWCGSVHATLRNLIAARCLLFRKCSGSFAQLRLLDRNTAFHEWTRIKIPDS